MVRISKHGCDLPPGFRFHPTDEELIMYYLRNQVTSKPCPVSIIPEVDVYKFDPWELPDKAGFGENEWYFFTPRDRKYPNGVRPNRAAVSGYWKATGTDKAIYSGSKYVGIKKALVFYKGRPPKGTKTDWIMHEYRLSESRALPPKQNGSMKLDDWVLCRIYKKRNIGKVTETMKTETTKEITDDNRRHLHHNHQIATCSDQVPNQATSQAMKLPRACSLTHLLEMDCLGSISQLLGDNNNVNNASFDSYYNQNTLLTTNSNGNGNVPYALGEVPYQYSQSSSMLNHQQPIFVMNPTFQFQ